MTTTHSVSSPWRARLPALVIGALVLLFLVIVAYAMQRSRASSELGAGGRINTSGTLVRFAGRQAPDFALPALREGPPVRLVDYRGKVVIVNFWGSWCPPCREEAPVLRRFASERPDVVLLGIDVWEKDWKDGRAFLDEFGIDYPNAYDPTGQVTIDFGVAGVPETFFIDPDGRLLAKYTGPIGSVEQLTSLMQELGLLQD